MASVRGLKRDIDYLMSMILNDCFYVLEYNAGVDAGEVTKIAADVIAMHREFRLRVNHPGGKDNPQLIKAYYKKLISEMLKFADESFERLSAEVKKVA